MVDFTPYSYRRIDHIPAGLEIITSEHALKDTDERLFPASKNRSRRIHKKLVKRFGGEFRKAPCIWRMVDRIIMHPTLYAEFQREMQRQQEASVDRAFF